MTITYLCLTILGLAWIARMMRIAARYLSEYQMRRRIRRNVNELMGVCKK